MKKNYTIILGICLFSIFSNNANAQGCVAIKSTGGSSTMGEHPGDSSSFKDKWLFNGNTRYYKSFRHFNGDVEQKERLEKGTEVINHSYTLDLTLTKLLNNRWSVSLDVPLINNDRSSLYEHGRVNRHSTSSFGLGDIRVSAYTWLVNPAKSRKGNIQAGLGLKLPTGNFNYRDNYFKTDGTPILAPVDQSIQLGDGGLGISTEINTYYNLSKVISAYGNFYYLINPREQNGVSKARGGTPDASDLAYGNDIMSVPDQYMIRVGSNFTFNKLSISAGLRDECLPAHDLIGGDSGWRRPGFIISAEPGITYKFRKFTAYSYVPVALVRNRVQNNADELKTAATGIFTRGDAAFADYSINAGISLKF